MPPLNPRADFVDDGGTPAWRARQAPPQLVIYSSRRAALRELLHKHPLFCILFPAIALYALFFLEAVAFLLYAFVCHLVGYE
jgi:hypothetical protein